MRRSKFLKSKKGKKEGDGIDEMIRIMGYRGMDAKELKKEWEEYRDVEYKKLEKEAGEFFRKVGVKKGKNDIKVGD